MSAIKNLQLAERRLRLMPGVKADVMVVLHETWRPADGEEATGVNFQRCDCHQWAEALIDRAVIDEDSV